MSKRPSRTSGRVAIVEIAATETSPAVLLVEVVCDGETLTISDQDRTLSDTVRAQARALMEQVRLEHDSRT